MQVDLALAAFISPWGLGVLGLMVGSFLNVVVHRLPASELRDWWRFDIADYALADGRAWKALLGPKVPPPPQLKAASDAIAGALDGLPLQTLVKPRSRCPHCGHVLRWYENIPVISWLATSPHHWRSSINGKRWMTTFRKLPMASPRSASTQGESSSSSGRSPPIRRRRRA